MLLVSDLFIVWTTPETIVTEFGNRRFLVPKNIKWTEENRKYLPVSTLSRRMRRKWDEKINTHNIFVIFPASTKYNLLHDKDSHNNGGCCGWSAPGMMKYNKLYAAIKNKRKKSAPTLNQELLKVFQSQQKKESGQGTKQLIDQKECKSWISLTTLMTVITIWQLAACPSKTPSFVIRNTVNSYSEVAYRGMK